MKDRYCYWSVVDGDYAVKVNLSKPIDAELTLPESVAGVPVKVEIVGNLSKR